MPPPSGPLCGVPPVSVRVVCRLVALWCAAGFGAAVCHLAAALPGPGSLPAVVTPGPEPGRGTRRSRME
ncbi:hypothetical protein GCM10025331_85580 [Actinoplanes utahensis]|nr:hypothetical protein Aut01nite_85450 [Actinoplanes utahensis]